MEMMAGQEQQEKVEARKAPLWEDVVDAFVSPAELFRRQAEGGWVKPWIVLSVIFIVVYFLFLGPNREIAQATAREMLARAGKTMPAAAQGGGAGQIIAGIFQPVGLLIGILLGAALLWIASAVAQGGPRFKQAMMIVAWASFPTLLLKVVQGVLVLIKLNAGEELSPMRDTSTGLLRFLDPASLPLPLVSALALVDIFAFWQMILWIVALRVICRYSTGKATAVAVATWLLMALPLMGMGYLGQLATGG